jgi:hypothetical protein
VCSASIFMTEKNCVMLLIGCTGTCDQAGRRCANGDVLRKFSRHVNAAREKRTPYTANINQYQLTSKPSMKWDLSAPVSVTHQGNPNVNPLIRQKSMHHGTLGWKHIRIMFRLARLHFFRRRRRTGIVPRRSIFGQHASRRMRGWPEFVRFRQDAAFGWLGRRGRSRG